MKSPEVEKYWQNFLASLPPETPRPQEYSAWYFGDGRELADELAELVLKGVKTATAGLLWEYEAEPEPVPKPGDYSVITDFDGRPLGVIQTTKAEVVPFDQVDAEQAFLEGEGDRSLAFWREGHWRFFSRSCSRLGRQPSGDMPVVCERFRLVYPRA